MIDILPKTFSIPVDQAAPYSETPDTNRPVARQIRIVRTPRAYGGAHSMADDTMVREQPLTNTVRSWADEKLAQIARHLGLLLSLPDGWDSYGARRIDLQRASAALDLLGVVMTNDLPAPAIVPTSDGGIQIEWHRCGVDLEIQVLSERAFLVYFEDLGTGEIWESEIEYDLLPLRPFIDRIVRC